MADRKTIMSWLEGLAEPDWRLYHSDSEVQNIAKETLDLLKEQEAMSPDEFKNELLKMFSSIWDCEIDHSIFQDTVGELMSAVMQLYKQAVKWDA